MTGILPLTDNNNEMILHSLNDHGPIVEEIKGLIKVYKDNHVERFPAVPEVPCTTQIDHHNLSSTDVVLDEPTGIWARLYLPKIPQNNQQNSLPILVYFHGGGFCVGSAAWLCYHEFLARLASEVNCLIMSVNYRLSPEHRLPAAFEDGLMALSWLRNQINIYKDDKNELNLWWRQCNFNAVFLCGDSAGASIAYHVGKSLGLVEHLKGLILIQPFFGGERRTESESNSLVQPQQHGSSCALSLMTSDSYWRLALPMGCDRDNPWCNPLGKGVMITRVAPLLVCMAELDILRDRSLEFCMAMRECGNSVEEVVYGDVGHAFQVLHNYPMASARTHEMIAHIKEFINKWIIG